MLIAKTYIQETTQYLQSVIKNQVNRSFIWLSFGGKNGKIKKNRRNQRFGQTDVVEIVKTFEKQGYIVVDDNEDNDNWKTWHVMVKV